MIRGTSAAANKNAVNEQYAQVQPIDGIFAERKHLTPSRNKAGLAFGDCNHIKQKNETPFEVSFL